MKQNVPFQDIEILCQNLNTHRVDIAQWSDVYFESMLANLTLIHNRLTVPHSPHYSQLCADLFARWNTSESPNKGYGLLEAGSTQLSFERIALKLIERNDNAALQQIIAYIDPSFHSCLFLRHAVQEMNMDAVRLLLPISEIKEVAYFAVEIANRTANSYLLDVFLPHADPTALNYALVRHAAHRCVEASDRQADFMCGLQRVLEAADFICVSKNQPPVSSNLAAIENLQRSIRGVVETAAQSVRFNRELEEQAFAAHTHSTRARKM